HRVAALVDHRPDRGADVLRVEPGGDPQIGWRDRRGEGMHGLIEAPGTLLQGEPLDHLARELLLRVERKVAMQAGIVHVHPALGDRGDERADAVAQVPEHRRHLRRGHPGLEVVEQGVELVDEAFEALEAIGVSPPELHVVLQVRQEGREVLIRTGLGPCVLGGRRGAGELGPQVRRHPARLLPAPARDAHQARVDGAVVEALGLAPRCLDQAPQLVGDELLVTDPRQRRHLVGAGLGPGRGHLRPLVPAHESSGSTEIVDLGQPLAKVLEAGCHSGQRSGRAENPSARIASMINSPWAGPSVCSTSSIAVSRTWSSTPSRMCSTSTTLAPCSPTMRSRAASAPGLSGTTVQTTSRRPAAVSPSRMHSASRDASTLPPDSTTQVSPAEAAVALPARRAATPTAPALSTTSFERSRRRTIAWATSSSDTVTMSSRYRSTSGRVSSPGLLTAIPSQIVLADRAPIGRRAASEST